MLNKNTTIKGLSVILAAFLSFFGLLSGQATAQSLRVGINLNWVQNGTPEQPFLNIFKTGSGWLTQVAGSTSPWNTGEQAKLAVDSNGYPTSLTPVGGGVFNAVGVVLLGGITPSGLSYPYPPGNYVVLYDGSGTLQYFYDAAGNRTTGTGRDVITINSPGYNGIVIQITATTAGNNLRNIRLVYSPDSTSSVVGTNESLLNSGEIFNPTFISRFSNFDTFRFVDWTWNFLQPLVGSWTARPTPSQAFWGIGKGLPSYNGGYSFGIGVPYEVQIALCNETKRNGWFNLPYNADDIHISNLASLLHSTLNAPLLAYIELNDEPWVGWPSDFSGTNGAPAPSYYVAQGAAVWGTGSSYLLTGMSWYTKRVSFIADTFASIWGSDFSRVIPLVNSQAANSNVAKTFTGGNGNLYGAISKNVKALAIAPYFGASVPLSWTTQPDGGLSYLFTEIMSGVGTSIWSGSSPGGVIQQSVRWVKANKSVADAHGLQLLAYEGGQGFGLSSDPSALTNLYMTANRDSRMGTAYSTYLSQMASTGIVLLNHYNSVRSYSQYGSWGTLENVLQTSSPKYDALVSFIAAH